MTLRLNWELSTKEERSQFLQQYLANKTEDDLSQDEIEMCGNYLLWARDSETGKNAVQEKTVQIRTRAGTWDKFEPESLDALMEQPTFNENQIARPGAPLPKVTREVFSRSEALRTAPDYMVPIYEELFRKIDTLDLELNYYDLAHGKRKKEPRESLVEKFTEEERIELQEKSLHLNQYMYLKKRHELVDLRRQQFSYKDSYAPIIQRHTMPIIDTGDRSKSLDVEIPVFPLGVIGNDSISKIIFADAWKPKELSENELKAISKYFWDKKEQQQQKYSRWIDFRDEEHILQLFSLFYEIADAGLGEGIEGTSLNLIRSLEFYMRSADLSEAQQEILDLKKKKHKNQDIADYINAKYDKSYSANYISTIFKQKIIVQIAEAAKFHETIIENLFYPENFKTCNTCGRLLFIDTHNFIRKARSHDGFANRCKICDRLERQRKKEK